jgi:hypothetical protein
MPLKLRMISVLLHMGMKRYILHIQKHTLLHSWKLYVTDGSTMQQDAWMHPFFTHLLYVLYKILNILTPPSNCATTPRVTCPPHYCGFTITLRRTTLGRTPFNEWSAQRKDLYLTTHNTHNRQTSMPPAGFKLTIPASELPQTHAVGHAATGIGQNF